MADGEAGAGHRLGLGQQGRRIGAVVDQMGVSAVHDLHVWGLSTTETALTAHLVHDRPDPEALLAEAHALARARFAIGHTTLQLEAGPLPDCPDC